MCQNAFFITTDKNMWIVANLLVAFDTFQFIHVCILTWLL